MLRWVNADEYKRTLMKQTVLKLRELLSQAFALNMRLQICHAKEFGIEREFRNMLMSEVNKLSAKAINVERMLCISCTKSRMATAKPKTLNSHR